mmetsp:Transcript_39763/g.92131  ORF Transcript_39763/g.92131 Transcript_39763/m.92131 type:complete len:443 (-) Transcript_39763:103-1431(-)
MTRAAGPHYAPLVLLPSVDDEAHHNPGPPLAGSCEQTRRNLQHLRRLNSAPTVPSLLSSRTSALVVGRDGTFVRKTTAKLDAMGVRAVGCRLVADALTALEDDIEANGCITYDQIICAADEEEEEGEGALALMEELEATSWPASVVLVASRRLTRTELKTYAACGVRALLRKPVNSTELGRLFTHLKRDPHEKLWRAMRAEAGQPSALKINKAISETPTGPARATPLHITAMGVGMAVYLHVHAGWEIGHNPHQTFEEAYVFESGVEVGEKINPERIYRFVVIVMVNLQLDEELLVTTVVLLERACRLAQLVLTESNWQSVLLAAIIVAAKTFYDETVWLCDFVSRLRMYPLDLSHLHSIEVAFLRALRFEVIVRPSSFYRYSSEIAKLHDAYCPYTDSMSCDSSRYRIHAKNCHAWTPQSPLASLETKSVCVPCKVSPGVV